MNFSYFELKQVAALRSHPGYIILVDSLKAQLDDLTNQLYEAKHEDEPRLLAKWRVFSQIYPQFVTQPEEFALSALEFEKVEETQNSLPPLEFTPTMTISPETEKLLKAAYEAKKNKLK